jgi:hypothetical protein
MALLHSCFRDFAAVLKVGVEAYDMCTKYGEMCHKTTDDGWRIAELSGVHVR